MLRVSSNKLTSVPPLPATLTDVCFAHNYLTALPTPMPPNLKIISAVGNLLAHLPDEMPATITQFWFDKNQLPEEEEDETIEHYLSEVKRLYAKYKARIIARTNIVFEEMMALVWHPDRLVRLIDQYGNMPQWNHDLQKYVPGFDFTAMNEVL
jgi:Leucine-rich repeat (LRR) protein